MAVVGMWSLPKKSFQGSFATVNLVSSQEIGLDSGALRKGSREAAGEGIKTQDATSSPSPAKAKAGPVVPIKRLRTEDVAPRPHADIKKLEAPEVPRFGEKSQSASVDKDLEKLIPKAKPAPKPTPIVQEQSEKGGRSGEGGSEKSAESKSRVSQDAVKGAPEGGAKGTADGHAKGVADSGGKGTAASSAAGSPDGEQLAMALRVYYIALQNAIRRQWNVPDFLKKEDLEAVVVVVLRRDGRVLDLKVEKKSGQPLFDDSAVRAIRKAEPLPAFPDIYSRQQMEFEFPFRPQDLR
jgi:colicin import membrane protein